MVYGWININTFASQYVLTAYVILPNPLSNGAYPVFATPIATSMAGTTISISAKTSNGFQIRAERQAGGFSDGNAVQAYWMILS